MPAVDRKGCSALGFVLALHIGLVACKPAEKVPLTGRVSVEYVGRSEDDEFQSNYLFNLANGSSGPVTFRGWSSMLADSEPSPDATSSRCSTAIGPFSSGRTVYTLRPGASPPESVEVSSGERIRLTVHASVFREFRIYKDCRCVLRLHLEDGSILESEEFKP
jgi:hypothetical protein